MISNFLVVDAPRLYNAIIERPTVNALQAVASMYHLALKFPTSAGIRVVRGSQVEARRCYALALKGQLLGYVEANTIGRSGLGSTGDLSTTLVGQWKCVKRQLKPDQP